MFEGILKYSQTIANNIERVNEINVKKATGKMIDANKDQLSQSRSTTGQNITPEYSPFTRKKKGFSNPNLYDTGDWQRGFFIDVNIQKAELNFKSSDYKTPLLVDKYSSKILGNTEINSERIFEDDIYRKDNEYIAKQENRFL